jgi:ribonuclease R
VPNSLPSVTMVQITHIDIDGDIFATPLEWDEANQGPAPKIELLSNAPMKEGDRALARLKKYSDKLYEGKLIRRIDRERATVLGQVKKTGKGFILAPADKKAKYDFDINTRRFQVVFDTAVVSRDKIVSAIEGLGRFRVINWQVESEITGH